MASSFVMTALQTGDDCQINDTNNCFPIESLRFPLDSSMRIIFTGYYNGFSVEVRSADEVALLYHMGCFGKGSESRSKPRASHNDGSPCIMRKRQFLKRNYWFKKFGGPRKSSEADTFLKEIEELNTKIKIDSNKRQRKDIIDLVSSEEDNEFESSEIDFLQFDYKEDTVVIVPNSDSEDEDYFANLKPKCCLNKIKLEEKLILTLQESFFLLYGLGCLQIVNDNKLLSIKEAWDLFVDTNKNFIPHYVVYHYFRSKGYVVKPGIKFGGDYCKIFFRCSNIIFQSSTCCLFVSVLYKEGPGVNHAEYIVVIKPELGDDWISILGHVRMATTTAKVYSIDNALVNL